MRQLLRSGKAILLENAMLDATQPVTGLIPETLRAKGDSGAYIVQSRAPPDDSFRRSLQSAGATIISYIPNNAYLVRASAASVQQLSADSQIQAVLTYEPYYKLQLPLLGLALGEQPLPDDARLNVLLFSDTHTATLDALKNLGLDVLAEEPSPFGPVVTVHSGATTPNNQILPAIAALPGVQQLELSRTRVFANDLSRARLDVASDSVTPDNYLGLTGTNVLVNVNDSGVDASHPDLTNRVFSDLPIGSVDTNGHGTHVAGIIAGSGVESQTVTNASGSVMPASPGQFRGMAPAANLFVISADPDHGPASDSYLQQTAARTNAFISNNSWHYGNDTAYDLAAARYDAAVRDALPGVSGSQPLLFVFGAGNAGDGSDNGSGGVPDTIQSPATAKNVITVGAIEQYRHITNQVYECSTVDSTNVCVTNAPWFGMTSGSNQVAAFSSRGNVGIGIEGEFGRFKPDLVAPGTFVISDRSTEWDQTAYYTPTNASDYFEVLSNLNDTIGPFYRYESGTSMSAAGASGVLALMQEFFNRVGRTNSPALMKALLINGARSLAFQPSFQFTQPTNSQGWGLINLTNSIPAALTNLDAASNAVLVFDQDPREALLTGQSRTRFISVAHDATNKPVRITLVWTDPPANPAAGVKLVNNLDLIVTNLVTGEVFFGNDFSGDQPFSHGWNHHDPPTPDMVNNVENIFLAPPLSTNYSVTVLGRGVNVNAVNAQTNGIAQDYALVISSDNGELPDALSLTSGAAVSNGVCNVTVLTNNFGSLPGISGALLMNQRVGANPPLLDANPVPWPGGSNGFILPGLTNQWRFYVLTNDQSYTNAAFVTFKSVGLAVSQDSNQGTNLTASATPQADIDLYVSTNAALINLDPTALAEADKSVHRGGTEMVLYTNALPGTYYIGVKAEDQQAAEFALMGVFSMSPFGTQDQTGTWTLQGINVPALIPDGGATLPGETNVIAIAPQPISVRRVVVTNEISHEDFSDLVGTLTHGHTSVVLNDHNIPPGATNEYTFVYEDNGEGDIPGSQPTTGPGSLRDFVGAQGQGVWILNMQDTALGNTGLVENLVIRLDPQNDLDAGSYDVQTNAFTFDFIDVPIGATNLTVCVNNSSDIPLPVGLYVRRGSFPDLTNFDQMLDVNLPSGCLSIGLSSLPPLSPGRYYIGVFNSNTIPQTVSLNASVQMAPTNSPGPIFSSTAPTSILVDAVTNATLFVTNLLPIASVAIELHVDDPRISDMDFTLVSPSGTRVMLCQNRGGASTNGMGGFPLVTNAFPTRSSGDFNASTNILQVSENVGTLVVDYNFYALPDTMHVYYEDTLIFDSGSVSNGGTFEIPFGPGDSTNLVVIMNEGNNDNTNTLWEYTATVISPVPGSVMFTENTNLATVPIKFAPTPFVSTGTNPVLYYLPEQSLNAFVGQSAFGQWQLEMRDTGTCTNGPPPVLAGWQLQFVFQNTVPIPVDLTPGGGPASNTVPPGEIAYFQVNVPVWATYATNTLISASGPINLLFNPANPPTGTNAGDAVLLADATGGDATVARSGSPSFVPGASYFLGVQNTNPFPVSASLEVDFDISVVTLTNGVDYLASNTGLGSATDYFRYTVSTNAVRAQFEIENPTANMTLVARDSFPVPTLTDYQFISANPGTNDELIVVFDSSSPIPLTPGDWYISAVNVSGGPATYSIRATEFPVYGTNITITGSEYSTNSLCLTWTSLPGINYYVQGKSTVEATNWSTVSPTIVAGDVSASYCVPLPSPYHFFRVHEGLVVTPCPPHVRIGSICCRTNGLLLEWTAPPNLQFSVEYSPTLSPANWTLFTNSVTVTNGAYTFFDDGAQAGMSDSRFYRLRIQIQ